MKNDDDFTIRLHDVNVNLFDVSEFLLLSLVTGSSFMLISVLVLELWQFSFIRDWPEVRILEIPLSEFFSICGDCRDTIFGKHFSDENLLNAEKCQGCSFYRFKIIKGKQRGGVNLALPCPRLGLTYFESQLINLALP